MSIATAVDPYAPQIAQARSGGWEMVPNLELGVVVHALIRRRHGVTDVVTIPPYGESSVVRLGGDVTRDNPRRPATTLWTHTVPVHVALNWLLTDPESDDALAAWQQRQSRSTDEPVIDTPGQHARANSACEPVTDGWR